MEVRFASVGKNYGGVRAVEALDLTVADGALHFLLGPSGCGKTTTLRMLAGLEAPSAGRILFAGRDMTRAPAAERGIGMVFQNYALWPHMTVRTNVEYGLRLRRLTPDELKRRLAEALALTQLTAYATRYPGQLSGGQQQRVALARALAIRPTVLLLDEPLSNLDAKLRLEMRDNISRIHRQTGVTTVYVTHDQKEALSMGTHVSVMRGGRLIQTDAPRRLYLRPRTPFVAAFIGETNLVRGSYLGRRADRHAAQTPLGVLLAGATDLAGPVPGQPVTLSFRPEAVQLAGAGAAAAALDNAFAATLVSLTYLGESEQLALLGAEGTALTASLFNPPEHARAAGDRVTCVVAPADVLLLPDEPDLSSGT